ncbi:MAG TPA: SDR family NAD(P)-dependent oxidoreductase [Microbacteriaceae bacterium]|nr:SDR family NAD(P)-dependent oxidoreductase [Microbacteriaceae bacterium]
MTAVGGRVAVVTGGASGIGRGIAEALRDAGAQVVIADIEQDALDAVAAELGVAGVQVDVSRLESVQALADTVLDRFGRVDIVVNNAGVGPLGYIRDLTVEDWRWLVDVNLFGVVHGIAVFLPILEANPDGGHIMNTASQAAFAPLESMGAYSATKFAVAATTEVLAAELASAGSKVTATLLAPGPVLTNIGTSSRNRPDGEVGGLQDAVLAETMDTSDWLRPEEVGRIAVRAIESDDWLAPTHPQYVAQARERFDRITAAYGKYPWIREEPTT